MTSTNYFCWRDEVLLLSEEVSGSGQLTQFIQYQIEQLGFDYFAMLIRHPVPFTRPKTSIYTTFPLRWQKLYRKENFIEIDPIIEICQFPGKIIEWNDQLFIGKETFRQQANAFGLLAGFSCSVLAKNRAIGILSASSRNPLKSIAFRAEFEHKLQYLTELYLLTLERIADVSMSVLDIEFSHRELEIIKWTAEGKTAMEISLILAISEHTVNFHQKNMQKRFNAANKTQLACYAAAVGLI
ncbi:LuxR family transcriptional regulator [[Pantoea] beijingensis]|uniref:LuxR family transcriptional regulator n=1 Tax=[Pantoea] beijingensis TaxID=1324864 RepID=A0A443IDH3_9GAMM|nr:transcriptional regulator SdiA [[Pantoea] beijingensis]RWR01966.1 LuxR family transcriptional regulator [[Pantoea] beijingensis]